MSNRKARWITLYIDTVARTVEARIRRVEDRTLGSRVYTLNEGEPSLGRLGRLLVGREYTSYGAQKGWGVTSINGRPRRIYRFKGRDAPIQKDTEYEEALAKAWGLMDAKPNTPEETELTRLVTKIVTYERRYGFDDAVPE